MLTLWDLLPAEKLRAWLRSRASSHARPIQPPPSHSSAPKAPTTERPAQKPRPAAQERYDSMTARLLEQHAVRVRKWRTSMSGIAWEVRYRDGSIRKLIEAPKPKGPMSAAVFLHEIGHHAIGFNRYKPRCLEEYHAWAWAIAAMEREGIAVTDRVRTRMHQSLAYAVAKARRRGIKVIPAELTPFLRPLPRKQSH